MDAAPFPELLRRYLRTILKGGRDGGLLRRVERRHEYVARLDSPAEMGVFATFTEVGEEYAIITEVRGFLTLVRLDFYAVRAQDVVLVGQDRESYTAIMVPCCVSFEDLGSIPPLIDYPRTMAWLTLPDRCLRDERPGRPSDELPQGSSIVLLGRLQPQFIRQHFGQGDDADAADYLLEWAAGSPLLFFADGATATAPLDWDGFSEDVQ